MTEGCEIVLHLICGLPCHTFAAKSKLWRMTSSVAAAIRHNNHEWFICVDNRLFVRGQEQLPLLPYVVRLSTTFLCWASRASPIQGDSSPRRKQESRPSASRLTPTSAYHMSLIRAAPAYLRPELPLPCYSTRKTLSMIVVSRLLCSTRTGAVIKRVSATYRSDLIHHLPRAF
jgi:hypothetical protein